jgi:alpha-glucosidase
MQLCAKILLGVALAAGWAAAAVELKSPDGNLALTFEVKALDGAAGVPCYRVAFQGRTLLADSRLGLELADAPLNAGLEIAGQRTATHDETWKPVYGERQALRDHYNELTVELRETAAPHRQLVLTFRAADEGVAFCYTLPKQPGLDALRITRETTQFHFAADHTTWATYQAQGLYTQVSLSKIKPGCERPLVVQVADDLFVAIAEARLVDYARMKLRLAKEAPTTLEAFLDAEHGPKDGEVIGTAPLTTPWRVVMAAASPGRLLENNFLILNLNDPCALADTAWIKPGKCIREVTLSTAGGKACVDFAVKHGLQYIEYDAGWYGFEYDPKSDAADVHLDPKRSKGPLDLHEVIRYGNAHGIGVILYVNHLAAEKQLDQILPLYQQWGIKGVKFGFVNVGSQKATSWLHHAIRRAADFGLLVDVHDEYRPTGYTRTYPNLLTVEGIRGDEEKARSNEQSLMTLFARFIAGPADNTVCYYDKRVDELCSHAYQLAKPVCLYSPWQFLFWYDRPAAAPAKTGGAGGAAPRIGDAPELEFYKTMPTVWDDTQVLSGKIGDHAIVARRSGAEWFVGVLHAGEPRTFAVPLKFLEPGQAYVAHIYSDDPAVPGRTHVKIERFRVTAATTLQAALIKNGGCAIRLVPATAADKAQDYR